MSYLTALAQLLRFGVQLVRICVENAVGSGLAKKIGRLLDPGGCCMFFGIMLAF